MSAPSWGILPRTTNDTRTVQRTVLIVADVDGTILDGEGRTPLALGEFRLRLRRIEGAQAAACTVALASSRTLAELVVLQRGLGMRGPCIAEDGAVLAIDTDDVPPAAVRGTEVSTWRAGRRTLHLWNLGESADALRAAFGELIAPYQLDTRDMAAMSALGFRSRASVRRALVERRASVLLNLAHSDPRAFSAVREAAAGARAHLHCGGRWHTLTRGAGKGAATSLLRRLLVADAGGILRVVGIGNEENDATLLANADVGFAIRNPVGGVHPALASVDGTIPLTATGTAGFVEMLDRLADMPLFEEAVR
jgi:mannosyl-3-phosphoglycerate phosphatase